ncbi:4Fe-4S ferredoxin [Collinsella sp. An7]|nr:4Fe-4S ferredoxin [Collinsella sp. An7]
MTAQTTRAAADGSAEPAKVYFTNLRTYGRESQLDKLKRLIRKAGIEQIDFTNKFVAIKIHFGELGNLSFLRPNYARAVADVVKELGGKPFLTDCNTLYVGSRKNALEHIDCAYQNGFTPYATGCHVIIADGLKGTDETLVSVKNGEYVKEAKIGHALMDADIVISLTHFKGHEQAGFGGAMKNLGMGGGSRAGKMEQHAAGKPSVHTEKCIGCRACDRICAHGAISFDETRDCELANGTTRTVRVASIDHDRCVGCGRCIGACNQDAIEPDYDAAVDVLNYKIAEYTQAVVQDRPNFHISLAIDISPNCDCHAENDTPIVSDLGMFASFDPVAIDQACIDMALAAPALPGTELTDMRDKLEAEGGVPERCEHDHFNMTHPDTNWRSMIEHAEKIGLGTSHYELIEVK